MPQANPGAGRSQERARAARAVRLAATSGRARRQIARLARTPLPRPSPPRPRPMPTPDEFFTFDLRVGTVTAAEPFPEARKPSIKLTIDFGPEVGTRRSSAQLTRRYAPEALVGRQVVAVVNFPPRRIAGFVSEVLVLGGVPDEGDVVLLGLDHAVPDGTRIA